MSYVREEVRWFGEQMEQKLRLNDHKILEAVGDDNQYEYCFRRANEEMTELREALDSMWMGGRQPRVEEVISECADVANFVMMLADYLRR
jgi:NTP pyrophosphatase (non-canonical NTP hydrolase)